MDVSRYKIKTSKALIKPKLLDGLERGLLGAPVRKIRRLTRFLVTGATFRAVGAQPYYQQNGQLEIKPWAEEQEQ